MDEYNDFRTAMTHFDILTEPKLILAVICSLVSKLVSNDTVAKATEELMRTYKNLDANRSITEVTHNEANDIPLFDPKVLTNSSLSPIDKGVYSVLCSLADKETLQCSPKVATIARKASCSESSVRKSLSTLEKHEVIRRKFRYINHRQISSLYTVIGSQASSIEQNTEIHTQNNASIVENNTAVEKVSNSTVQEGTCFLGDTKNRAMPLHEEGNNSLHKKEGEKTLRVFKDSLREEGVNLPASAEEVTTPEKNSLTGGALLPSFEDENEKPGEVPESIPSTLEDNEKTPVIRAGCDGTDNICTTSQPKSELSEALLREYDQLRRECAEIRKPIEEPKSITSGLMDIMADIGKRTVIKSGDCEVPTLPENPSAEAYEAPVIKTEAVSRDNSMCSEKTATDVAKAEVVPADKSPAPMTVSDTPASSSKAQTENVSAPKDTGKKPEKKSCKGKRTVSRHPKERYLPEDAPEIMRSTAEYFLFKTGRVALRWEEISVLRTFSATQYPAMVQKEIRRACARFEKNKEPLECLTLMYIAAALKDRPTFGQKEKKKTEVSPWLKQYMPEKKKERTPEETAAALARLEALEATLNPGD